MSPPVKSLPSETIVCRESRGEGPDRCRGKDGIARNGVGNTNERILVGRVEQIRRYVESLVKHAETHVKDALALVLERPDLRVIDVVRSDGIRRDDFSDDEDRNDWNQSANSREMFGKSRQLASSTLSLIIQPKRLWRCEHATAKTTDYR